MHPPLPPLSSSTSQQTRLALPRSPQNPLKSNHNLSQLKPDHPQMRSRKRTNMVIDFGDAPVTRARTSDLPDVEDELADQWQLAGKQMEQSDLDDKVFRMAMTRDSQKRGNKVSKTRRVMKAYPVKTRNTEQTVDDGDISSARRLFPQKRSQRSVSDDEDMDHICSRNFNLKTPCYNRDTKDQVVVKKKTRKREKMVKSSFFSTYRNGNIASPSFSPQWMIPHRRVPRNTTPAKVFNTRNVSPFSTSFSSASSGLSRTKKTPSITPKEKNRNSVRKLRISKKGSFNNGECSPSTPRTPREFDVDNESVATLGSDLELVCKDQEGLAFCVQTLQKLSPISKDLPRSNRSWSFSSLSGSLDAEASPIFENGTPSQSPTSLFKQPEVKFRTPQTPCTYEGGNNSLNSSGYREGGNNSLNSSGYREGGNNSLNSSGYREGGNNSLNSSGYRSGSSTPSRGNVSGTNSNAAQQERSFTKTSLRPPLHSPRQKTIDSLLSPDPRAFELKNKLQRTPTNACPPTPMARPRLHRATSLGQTKMLASVTNDLGTTLPSWQKGKQISQRIRKSRLVGEGSFFKVYKTYLKGEKGKMQQYALKASKRTFRSKNDRAMYLREVELVKSIPLHPNIVKYIACWQEELRFYVVMEYCRCTLEKLVSMIKISSKFLWTVLFQVSRGLEHIHRHGILHMDIKPGNILYGMDKVLKLADFGQAISTNRITQMLDGCEGDSNYMAPELMKNNAIPTEAADVFSLGLLMIEIATQKPLPAEGPKWQDLRKGRAREYLIGRVDRNLESIILKMLSPNPPGRPSAAQVAYISMDQLKREQHLL